MMSTCSACPQKVTCLAFLTLALLLFIECVRSQDLRVQSIQIIRKQILDVGEGGGGTFFADLLNGLHVTTAESVIRRELLFAEGDVYDHESVAESERNLWNMGIFSEVTVQADTLPGNLVEIRFITRERWTLAATAMAKQEAGIRSGIVGISEKNLLGGGQKIGLHYNYSSSRNDPYGIQMKFEENRLLGSRWRSSVQYRNAEELRLASLQVERPFFSEHAGWAGGLTMVTGRERLWYDPVRPDDANSFRSSTRMSLWYVRSSGEDVRMRLGGAYHRVRTQALPQFVTASGDVDLFSLSVGILKREFSQTFHVDEIGGVEYVSTGYAASVIGAVNLSPSREKRNLSYFRFGSRIGVQVREDLYCYSDLAASTYTDFSDLRDGAITWHSSLLHRVAERHTVAGRFFVMSGVGWSPSRLMVVGGLSGLRGYGPYDLVGYGGALLNLEHRAFPELEILYFRPSLVLFLDSGVTWQERQRPGKQRWYSAAGIGFRVANKRFLGSTMIRVDFAYNFSMGRWGQIIFSTDHVFRALGNVDADLPTIFE